MFLLQRHFLWGLTADVPPLQCVALAQRQANVFAAMAAHSQVICCGCVPCHLCILQWLLDVLEDPDMTDVDVQAAFTTLLSKTATASAPATAAAATGAGAAGAAVPDARELQQLLVVERHIREMFVQLQPSREDKLLLRTLMQQLAVLPAGDHRVQRLLTDFKVWRVGGEQGLVVCIFYQSLLVCACQAWPCSSLEASQESHAALQPARPSCACCCQQEPCLVGVFFDAVCWLHVCCCRRCSGWCKTMRCCLLMPRSASSAC